MDFEEFWNRIDDGEWRKPKKYYHIHFRINEFIEFGIIEDVIVRITNKINNN